MKPLRITNVVNGVVALKTAGVVNQATVDAVVNTIFNEIQSGDAVTLFTEINNLESDLHDYSEYLYKTTDEINAEIGAAGSNVARLNIAKTELNNVFTLMNDGYSYAGTIKQNHDNLLSDFFDANSSYKLNYESNYANIASQYTETVIDTIVSNIYAADAQLTQQSLELSRLSNTYSAVLEPTPDPGVATFLPKTFWVRTEDNPLKLSIYTDNHYITGLGSNFGVDSLITKSGGSEAPYTIHFSDNASLNANLTIIASDSSSVVVPSGSSINLSGASIRSLVPTVAGVPQTTVNNSGANSVINIIV